MKGKSRSLNTRMDRTVPEKKPKGMQIWLVMGAQVMGIHRVLVNGKDGDGLHLAMSQLHQDRDERKRKQRFEKLQEKMKDLGLVWMCAAEEQS